MQKWALQKFKTKTGFTIVELLIVVVVIAILAAITLVAFNGITKRATQSGVQEALSQVNRKVLLYYVDQGSYPATLADAGVTDQSGSPFYNYVSDNVASPAWYQLTVSNGINGTEKYNISSDSPTIQAGAAVGNNVVAWDKKDDTTAPILTGAGIAIDTTVFRTSLASVRLSPGATFKNIRVYPVSGTVGQTVRVGTWVKTDAGWNGTSGNSKIRFGTYPAGNLLNACSYQGPKATWTYYSCNFTLTATDSSVGVSFGNDGTVGNVWLDDVSVSVR